MLLWMILLILPSAPELVAMGLYAASSASGPLTSGINAQHRPALEDLCARRTKLCMIDYNSHFIMRTWGPPQLIITKVPFGELSQAEPAGRSQTGPALT